MIATLDVRISREGPCIVFLDVLAQPNFALLITIHTAELVAAGNIVGGLRYCELITALSRFLSLGQAKDSEQRQPLLILSRLFRRRRSGVGWLAI